MYLIPGRLERILILMFQHMTPTVLVKDSGSSSAGSDVTSSFLVATAGEIFRPCSTKLHGAQIPETKGHHVPQALYS